MSKENAFDALQIDKVKSIRLHVEDNSDKINDIVYDIIQPYCEQLDKYVDFISSVLKDGENPPTDSELDDFCLNLATCIYFACGMCEQLGIKDDISKAIYKEVYHASRNNVDKGTVADKDSLAELASQQEYLTNVCYSRAYKIMKAKVENAQELLSSIKKVLSHRMQEQELTKIGGN